MSTDNEGNEKGLYDDQNNDWGQKYGWFHSQDSERVYNPQDGGSGPLIITEDGEIEGRYLRRAMDKVAKGRGMLWGRLGPVEIDGIEIRRNTKLWHEDREAWLRAYEIGLIEEPDVEPTITFTVEGAWPKTRLTYPASRLAELREEGVIESQKEVNDRAEQALENFREERQE